MTFEFLVAVEVKNDGLTRDTPVEDLTVMLMRAVLKNQADELPWVLSQDISVITRDTRESA
jgi:hypothetical protein